MKEKNYDDLTKFEQPSVTVDLVIFTIQENKLKILLVNRDVEPFKGKWALPGGFVQVYESLEDAAKRELVEETGVENVYLEQLYSFGNPKRDPRGRVITISYFALINSENIKLNASTDVSEAKWFSISMMPTLAFDHKEILDYAIKRLKWKFEYTSVAFSLLPKKFTISQVQKVYEIIFNKKFDKRNFFKKILSLDILKEEGINQEAPHRPPMLYSLKKSVKEIVNIL